MVRRFSLIIFSICLALLFLGQTPVVLKDYKIGPTDVLKITVFGEPDLERSVRVAADGSISYPLVGRVEVVGLTPSELEDKLGKLLGDSYLVNPQVSVAVLEYNSQKVYVLGAVKEPGYYDLKGPTTILEIISRAGGITNEGGKNIIITIKNSDGQAEVKVVDRDKLLSKGEVSLDVPVKGGDVVYIPRAEEVYVLGEVKKPGAVPYQENLTLLQAVSVAGGLTDQAAPRRTRIIRAQGAERSTLDVNLKQILEDATKDIKLLPNDVVVVPRSII